MLSEWTTAGREANTRQLLSDAVINLFGRHFCPQMLEANQASADCAIIVHVATYLARRYVNQSMDSRLGAGLGIIQFSWDLRGTTANLINHPSGASAHSERSVGSRGFRLVAGGQGQSCGKRGSRRATTIESGLCFRALTALGSRSVCARPHAS